MDCSVNNYATLSPMQTCGFRTRASSLLTKSAFTVRAARSASARSGRRRRSASGVSWLTPLAGRARPLACPKIKLVTISFYRPKDQGRGRRLITGDASSRTAREQRLRYWCRRGSHAHIVDKAVYIRCWGRGEGATPVARHPLSERAM